MQSLQSGFLLCLVYLYTFLCVRFAFRLLFSFRRHALRLRVCCGFVLLSGRKILAALWLRFKARWRASLFCRCYPSSVFFRRASSLAGSAVRAALIFVRRPRLALDAFCRFSRPFCQKSLWITFLLSCFSVDAGATLAEPQALRVPIVLACLLWDR